MFYSCLFSFFGEAKATDKMKCDFESKPFGLKV